MAANAAAAAASTSDLSQDEYEKQLSGKSAASIFTNDTVRADFTTSFTRLNESEGKDAAGDTIASGASVDQVLPKFRGMIKERFEADKEKGLSDARKWLFQSVPLHLCRGKTLDDFFTGYLLWSQKEKDVAAKRFNLSKALRRLEACADFGWKHKARLEVPTKLEDLERAYGQWGQVVGQHPDPDGRTVWFIDLTMIDTPAMKKEANWDLHLRLFWWVVTWLAMDPNTQKNGITFWQDMGYAGMMDLLTLVPRDLNNDIDELSSGVAAIKMKHFYISRNPWWGRLLLNMMWMFLSDKMKQRFTVIPGEDWPALYAKLGGVDKVPACFGDGSAKGSVVDRMLGKALFEPVPGGGRRVQEIGTAKERPEGAEVPAEFDYDSDDEFSL